MVEALEYVQQCADNMRLAKMAYDKERDTLIDAIKIARSSGISELAISREARLNRMSVRRWLGKMPSKSPRR